MFERGIDPDVEDPEQCHAHSEIPEQWPVVGHIMNYQERVRNRLRAVSQMDGLDQNRCLAEALWIGFEHEAMHLETFLYMLLQSERTMPPPGFGKPDFEGLFYEARKDKKPNEWFTIPKQTLSIGLDIGDESYLPTASFGWDNEIPARTTTVHAFEAQARPITNGEFAKYLEANRIGETPASWVPTRSDKDYPISNGVNGSDGYAAKNLVSKFAVRTVFGPVPLKFAQDWPLMASYDELNGYAQWVKCRIPTFEEARSIYSYAAQFKEAERNNTSNGHVLVIQVCLNIRRCC
jgi:formylglycine-generating enzyme required for sulfatase activity